ncbi:hypothetical protein RFI_27190, partial [Reticulomyxa filosa]
IDILLLKRKKGDSIPEKKKKKKKKGSLQKNIVSVTLDLVFNFEKKNTIFFFKVFLCLKTFFVNDRKLQSRSAFNPFFNGLYKKKNAKKSSNERLVTEKSKNCVMTSTSATAQWKYPFIDIGANLLDPMFQGVYNKHEKHSPDLAHVLTRAWSQGLQKIIVTAGSLSEAQEALKLVRFGSNKLYDFSLIRGGGRGEIKKINFLKSMIESRGARIYEPTPRSYANQKSLFLNTIFFYLLALLIIIIKLCNLKKKKKKKLKVNEYVTFLSAVLCGPVLLKCKKRLVYKQHLQYTRLAEETKLPLFLHNRKSSQDLIAILKNNWDKWNKAVVHSFDGCKDELFELLKLNDKSHELYIGINGCSMKTPENIEVIKCIPLDRLLIETDCPWCGIRNTHASSPYVKTTFKEVNKPEKCQPDMCVKGRSEPCHIVQVFEVIAHLAQCNAPTDIHKTAQRIFDNTMSVFFSPSDLCKQTQTKTKTWHPMETF